MQRDSAEQHKNHISNLMSNEIDELEDRKNQSILEGDSLGLRANSSDIKVLRRNGAVVPFEASKISIAMTKAFLAVQGGTSAASAKVRQMTEEFTARVEKALLRRLPSGGTIHIEEIQDQVELALMRAGEHEVARSYVLYREERAKERREKSEGDSKSDELIRINVDGELKCLDENWLNQIIEEACRGYTDHVEPKSIYNSVFKNLYDGIKVDDLIKTLIMTSKTFIEKDPLYAKVTAQLLLYAIRKEVLGRHVQASEAKETYKSYFPRFIEKGIQVGVLSSELESFDLEFLGETISPERDFQFGYLGLQTLYDRYFLIDRNDSFSKEGKKNRASANIFYESSNGVSNQGKK